MTKQKFNKINTNLFFSALTLNVLGCWIKIDPRILGFPIVVFIGMLLLFIAAVLSVLINETNIFNKYLKDKQS